MKHPPIQCGHNAIPVQVFKLEDDVKIGEYPSMDAAEARLGFHAGTQVLNKFNKQGGRRYLTSRKLKCKIYLKKLND